MDSSHAWIVGAGFFQRTTDAGKTWQPLAPAPHGDMQFSDPGHGWVVSAEGGAGSVLVDISSTRDGGKTWQPVQVTGPNADPADPALRLSTTCGDSFYYSDHRQMILHGFNGTCGDSVDLHYKVALSTDLGQTWASTSLALPSNADQASTISPLQPVFFDNQSGILPFVVSDLNDSFPPYLAVYHTQDGGAHWLPAPGVLQPAYNDELQIVSPQIYTVRCEGGLCITTDGAHSWRKIPFDQDSVLAYSFISPQLAFALSTQPVPGTDNEQLILWKTQDAGAAWVQLPASALPTP